MNLKACLRRQLYNARLTGLVTARATRYGAPIFMLHHTLPKGSPCFDPGMDTEVGLFDSLLGWIKRNFDVVPLETLTDTIHGERRRERVCSITLDDGWWDTYEHAFPILRKHGLAATVFLPLDYIGSDRQLWQDSLWDIYQQLKTPRRIEEYRRMAHDRYPWWPADERMATSHGAICAIVRRSLAELDELVSWSRSAFGLSCNLRTPGFMTWAQVKEMHQAGMQFGSHTNSHVLLTQVPLAEAREEIVSSKTRLEAILGAPVTSLCYPAGRFDAELARVAEAAGYHVAVTAEPRLARRRDSRWALPRVGVSSRTLEDGDGFNPNALKFQMARAGLRARLRLHEDP